MTQQTSNSN